MKFILYQILLNIKWYCSNILRCLIAGIWITLPFLLLELWSNSLYDEPIYLPGLKFMGVFALINSFMFWIIGYGLGKFHPPTSWRNHESRPTNILVNSLLTLPLLISIFSLLLDYEQRTILYISIPLTAFCLFILFLVNRHLTNEDPELANSQTHIVTANNITPKQLRSMRISSLILGLATMVLIFMYTNAKIELDYKTDELRYQRMYFEETEQELNARIDSLTTEIDQLKKTTDSNP
jgi:hypothetical protein